MITWVSLPCGRVPVHHAEEEEGKRLVPDQNTTRIYHKAACFTDAGLVGEYLSIRERERMGEMSVKQNQKAIKDRAAASLTLGL
jgi:hypothetical protein